MPLGSGCRKMKLILAHEIAQDPPDSRAAQPKKPLDFSRVIESPGYRAHGVLMHRGDRSFILDKKRESDFVDRKSDDDTIHQTHTWTSVRETLTNSRDVYVEWIAVIHALASCVDTKASERVVAK